MCHILHAVLCQSKTKRGAVCPRTAGEDGFCAWHSPEQRRQRASEGGRARAKTYAEAGVELDGLALRTVEDVRELIRRAIGLAERSKADGTIRARVLLNAASAALEALKVGDLESELRELRALVDERLGGAKP